MREAHASGEAVSVHAMELDPALAGAGLEAADVDGDGRIDGERELRRLFDLLDRHDGRRDGKLTLERGGRATPAAPMAAALGEELDIDALRAVAGTADATVLLGMNDTAVGEARALRRQAPVLLVHDVATRKDVAIGGDGRAYDLRSEASRRGYVATLALPDRVAGKVLEILRRVPEGARRELAALARIWAPGERGEAIPPRLLVSGHGDSRAFFGDDGDGIDDADLADMAQAMPRAAAQVRHLHLAACQHGYDPRMETFREVFPALESIWGYSGFSPSGAPAYHHQSVWERATRDRDASPDMSPRDVAGTRRAPAVSIWTRERGFDGPAARELGIVCDELDATYAEYERYFTGEAEVRDPRTGPLADRYQRLQEVVNHLDFADQRAGFRRRYEHQRDAALRLRFFTSHVTRAFDRHYGDVVDAGYRALGLAPVRFTGMTRREAYLEARRFLDAYERAGKPAAAARAATLLDDGLIELRAEHIPSRWL